MVIAGFRMVAIGGEVPLETSSATDAFAISWLWLLGEVPSASAQLNENCTVRVLNQTARVKPDGTKAPPNVPAGIGEHWAFETWIDKNQARM